MIRSELLQALARENPDLRADEVEQLQADGRDAAEVTRARIRLAARHVHVDPGREAFRIHRLRARREEDVDAGRPCKSCVALLVTRIAIQVLA